MLKRFIYMTNTMKNATYISVRKVLKQFENILANKVGSKDDFVGEGRGLIFSPASKIATSRREKNVLFCLRLW